MTWRAIGPSERLRIDWPKVFSQSSVDPYLVWAEATAFKGLAKLQPNFLQIAFELRHNGDVQKIERALEMRIQPVAGAIHTASVPIQSLRSLYASENQELWSRFVMGMPSVGPIDINFFKSKKVSKAQKSVMVVIDDGCSFAHHQFRRPKVAGWTSRLLGIWDQNTGADPLASQGREFLRAQLEAVLNAAALPGGVDEEACYRLISQGFSPEYAVDYMSQMRRPASHGTHVLDVAAGRPNPLASLGLGDEVDLAAKADVLFVQLPQATVKDTSGGSLDVYVLQALAYVRARCPKRKVVVNLSYGSYGGPHDGHTILEAAMDAFIDDTSAIVLPAGNAYDARIHAAIRLNPNESRSLSVHVQPDSLSDTFVEFWYSTEVNGSSNSIEIEVSPPVAGDDLGPCKLNTAFLWYRPTPSDPAPTEPAAGLIHLQTPSAGKDKSLAVLAVAPTGVVRPARPRAPHGVWTIRVSNKAAAGDPIDIRAWVERDDASFGSGRSQSQAVFLSAGVGPAPGEPHAAAAPIVREENLSSIGHGSKTTVAGGYILKQKRMARYSASGPSIEPGTRKYPDLVAACEESEVLNGMLAAGNRTSLPFRMNGTSVAAPVVARALFNHLDDKAPAPLNKQKLPPEPLPPSHPPVDPELREGLGRLIYP